MPLSFAVAGGWGLLIYGCFAGAERPGRDPGGGRHGGVTRGPPDLHLPRQRPDAAGLAPGGTHDALTGLLNRRALTRDLARSGLRATHERPLVLVIFDLDGFKLYNDTFGHPAGDALLTGA